MRIIYVACITYVFHFYRERPASAVISVDKTRLDGVVRTRGVKNGGPLYEEMSHEYNFERCARTLRYRLFHRIPSFFLSRKRQANVQQDATTAVSHVFY